MPPSGGIIFYNIAPNVNTIVPPIAAIDNMVTENIAADLSTSVIVFFPLNFSPGGMLGL